MSWVGNIAAAVGAIQLGKYNKKLYDTQAAINRENERIKQKTYENIDKPRLLAQQEREYSEFFVSLLKSGVEVRSDTTPYFVMLESEVNQATDLAIADYNSKQAYFDGINQSLLLESQGQGELYKGKLTARTETIKGLATMGGNYYSSGSILTA